MDKEFVPYELALKLKELGFDEPCMAFYEEKHLKNFVNPFLKTQILNSDLKGRVEGFRVNSCVAPLWQQAFDWFREKHSIQYRIVSKRNFGRLTFYMTFFNQDEIPSMLYNPTYTNYEEARLACLQKMIKTLDR